MVLGNLHLKDSGLLKSSYKINKSLKILYNILSNDFPRSRFIFKIYAYIYK